MLDKTMNIRPSKLHVHVRVLETNVRASFSENDNDFAYYDEEAAQERFLTARK